MKRLIHGVLRITSKYGHNDRIALLRREIRSIWPYFEAMLPSYVEKYDQYGRILKRYCLLRREIRSIWPYFEAMRKTPWINL